MVRTPHLHWPPALVRSPAVTYIVGRGGKLNPGGVFVVERPGLGEFLRGLTAFAEVCGAWWPNSGCKCREVMVSLQTPATSACLATQFMLAFRNGVQL